MELKFLGNGSGFTDKHTNAFYEYDGKLILIDLSMLNIQKALKVQENYSDVNVIVTHMHDDHVSGIGLFAQYLFYCYHKKLKIFVPNNLFDDMQTEMRIKGINMDIIELSKVDKGVLGIENVIETNHAPELKGKCFGYIFKLNDKLIVYTGDTCKLEDFESYLKDCNEFYVDCSYNYGGVHLKWTNVKEKLIEFSKIMFVYLMHIDNEDIRVEVEDLKNEKLKIAEIIDL